MFCEGCKNEKATKIKIIYENGERFAECNSCGDIGSTTYQPDVFFQRPYMDEHLADDQHRNGQYITSRAHKASVLKKLGLQEAGDMKNPILGRPAPYISDVKRRQRFFKDNYGG